MSTFNYKPIDDSYGGCCKPEEPSGDKEVRYPSVYLDVSPEQLKSINVDEDVEIVIRGKVKSMRFDTDDNYGTGASINISLRSNELKNTDSNDDIAEMLGDD